MRGCGLCCFRVAFAQRRPFVSREGGFSCHGACREPKVGMARRRLTKVEDAGRPNGGQLTASPTFRSKRRRAIPAAEPPGRPRGSWSREAPSRWELATLVLATFPHWQHSFHVLLILGFADTRLPVVFRGLSGQRGQRGQRDRLTGALRNQGAFGLFAYIARCADEAQLIAMFRFALAKHWNLKNG